MKKDLLFLYFLVLPLSVNYNFIYLTQFYFFLNGRTRFDTEHPNEPVEEPSLAVRLVALLVVILFAIVVADFRCRKYLQKYWHMVPFPGIKVR